jgi:hypothetical protein
MVLEDLLSEFNAHKLVRIPGLIQSLVNLVTASPTNPEAKLEGLHLSMEARKFDDSSFYLDAAAMEQVKLIERQYISENLKVEQVCEDVVQRMKGLLGDQRRCRYVSVEEEQVQEKSVRAKFYSVRLLLRERYQEYILYCQDRLKEPASTVASSTPKRSKEPTTLQTFWQKRLNRTDAQAEEDSSSAQAEQTRRKRGNLPKTAVQQLYLWYCVRSFNCIPELKNATSVTTV